MCTEQNADRISTLDIRAFSSLIHRLGDDHDHDVGDDHDHDAGDDHDYDVGDDHDHDVGDHDHDDVDDEVTAGGWDVLMSFFQGFGLVSKLWCQYLDFIQ